MGGKAFVLILLGFASTDFIITMTLSAADAAAHFVHNPYTPHWLSSQMLVTLLLLAGLGATFLKGFKEAIGIAVILVAVYLILNAIVTIVSIVALWHHQKPFRTGAVPSGTSIPASSASLAYRFSCSRSWLLAFQASKPEWLSCP